MAKSSIARSRRRWRPGGAWHRDRLDHHYRRCPHLLGCRQRRRRPLGAIGAAPPGNRQIPRNLARRLRDRSGGVGACPARAAKPGSSSTAKPGMIGKRNFGARHDDLLFWLFSRMRLRRFGYLGGGNCRQEGVYKGVIYI